MEIMKRVYNSFEFSNSAQCRARHLVFGEFNCAKVLVAFQDILFYKLQKHLLKIILHFVEKHLVAFC